MMRAAQALPDVELIDMVGLYAGKPVDVVQETRRLLEGTPVLVAATAGNLAEAYTPAGQNFFSLPALLQPLEATAYRCKLPWYPPFLAYRANKLDAAELEALGQEYCAYLECWMRERPARLTVV